MHRFPWFGWLGLLLMGGGQVLTLWHLRPLSDYWYGLCWAGFFLAADAWVYRRSGRCLLRDRRADVGLMLVVSTATWWGLELGNQTLQSWAYSASPDIPMWRQRLRSTLFFATLIPATWAGLLAALTWRDWRGLTGRRRLAVGRGRQVALATIGVGCLVAVPRHVDLGLGLVLLGLLLLLDPINHGRGRPSLLGQLARGDYRVPVLLPLATMLTGVVGEMWNYPASPKWRYHVPLIDFWHVFEMPLLGFFGYGLLASTLFAVYHFARGLVLPLAPEGTDDALSQSGL
ncbi:MAG: hypothetical protein KC731_15165 [Myxococcales bacterium]|nr:hypothetical protein [Myxococcales bacterium]